MLILTKTKNKNDELPLKKSFAPFEDGNKTTKSLSLHQIDQLKISWNK